MELQSLGYFGIRAKSLDDWASFGVKFLGMQLVDRSRSTLTFRMDDRRQRVVVHADGGQGTAFMGWEVADGAALDALAARLEASGVRVRRLPRATADERRVKEILSFDDPVGNPLEAFHGAEVATDPFQPGRAISGFRTGPLGMGHVVMNVERIDLVLPFYQDVLGFQLSDYTLKPFKAYFFHLNPRHHSFAVIETGHNSVHHLMVELFMLDDVGQAYDLALGEEGRIATTFGRHSNDLMTSFYSRTPSGFFVEYGWGGRSLDPKTWKPVEMTRGPSLWGTIATGFRRPGGPKRASCGCARPPKACANRFRCSKATTRWRPGRVRGGTPRGGNDPDGSFVLWPWFLVRAWSLVVLGPSVLGLHPRCSLCFAHQGLRGRRTTRDPRTDQGPRT